MRADDPRHGTPGGYQAHWRDGEDPCDACSVAKFRYGKSVRIAHASGTKMHYTAAELSSVLAPWLAMGLSPTAIATAAGLEGQRSAHFAKTIANGTGIRRSTYLALAAVTEDDFAPQSKVFSDLTRRRVFSLMAAGHRLRDMPINTQGQWRYREHVAVETARLVRAYYRENEARLGNDRCTQSRARNAGHVPPMAWDDPGTLAWPNGVTAVPTDWQYREPTRAEILEDLDDRQAGISEALNVLGLKRSTLDQWCRRNGHGELFSRLMAREDAGQVYRNQYSREAS